MTGLIRFLTKIQTFNLLIVTKSELENPIKEDEDKSAYSLAHETHYYDSFTYKSEIRVLKDMALIDLLSLNDTSLKREFEQLKKFQLVNTPQNPISNSTESPHIDRINYINLLIIGHS